MLQEREVTLVVREAAAEISPAASKQPPTVQTHSCDLRATHISPVRSRALECFCRAVWWLTFDLSAICIAFCRNCHIKIFSHGKNNILNASGTERNSLQAFNNLWFRVNIFILFTLAPSESIISIIIRSSCVSVFPSWIQTRLHVPCCCRSW